jgi:hypothetical protein
MAEQSERWTSDHLLAAKGTKIYGDMWRELLRPAADEVRALEHEYRPHLATQHIDGDLPLQAQLRARRASRPLARMERHLRAAIAEAQKLDAEYKRAYEELPRRRQERRRKRNLKKVQRRELAAARKTGNSAQVHAFIRAVNKTPPGGSPESPGDGQDAPTFMEFLAQQRRA